MILDNPYETPTTPSLLTSQRFSASLLRLLLAAPALIAVGLFAAGVWYGYFTVQNFRYHGIVHPHGSMLTLSTFIGGTAWMLNTWCLARHRWLLGIAFASVGFGCFFWISKLT